METTRHRLLSAVLSALLVAPALAQEPEPSPAPVPGALHELISALITHPPLAVDGEAAYALDTLRQPPNLEARRPLLLAAVETLQARATRRPDDPAPHQALAAAYFDLGAFARSAEHFGRLVQMQPHQAQHHNDLGVVYLRMGRVDDARRELRQAFSMNRRRFASLAAVLHRPPLSP